MLARSISSLQGRGSATVRLTQQYNSLQRGAAEIAGPAADAKSRSGAEVYATSGVHRRIVQLIDHRDLLQTGCRRESVECIARLAN